MSTDQQRNEALVHESARPRSRRALLTGLLGGAAAWAASSIGRATPVSAANGDPVTVGAQNLTGTQTTLISSATQSISVLWGNSTANTGSGVGLRGDSASQGGSGVWGNSTGTGVSGTSDFGTGVRGTSNSAIGVRGTSGSSTAIIAAAGVVGDSSSGHGVWGISTAKMGVYGSSQQSTGVLGETQADLQVGVRGVANGTNSVGVRGDAAKGRGVLGLSTTGRGVHGESDSGWGVYGRSDTSHGVHGVGPGATAVGVYGESSAGVAIQGKTTSGYALSTNGRLKLDKISGVATIAAGQTAVTVTPGVDVTTTSFVLLTPKANIGSRSTWYTTDTTANTITVRISASRTVSTPVAWLLVN